MDVHHAAEGRADAMGTNDFVQDELVEAAEEARANWLPLDGVEKAGLSLPRTCPVRRAGPSQYRRGSSPGSPDCS